MSIIVGRSPWGEQAQKIDSQSVSRKHFELTRIDQNHWRIRDVGSRYGTMVKGLPVVETVVGLDDPIIMGDFETTVRKLIGQKTPPVVGPAAGNKIAGTASELISVRPLEKVYNDYQDKLKALAIKKGKANVMRMLPLQLIMPLALGLTGILIPDDQTGSLIKGLVMVVVMGLTVVMSLRLMSISTHQIDEQFELNKQFQIDYVCPKCKNFFGAAKPYQALVNQGQCPFCKSRFAESE
ncbi:MAG: FHA domain-containing protein [Muribaculaceae bacterium]|nr:FHA domain-containing protein [Muribaculaceae bacterium]